MLASGPSLLLGVIAASIESLAAVAPAATAAILVAVVEMDASGRRLPVAPAASSAVGSP